MHEQFFSFFVYFLSVTNKRFIDDEHDDELNLWHG